jgi:PAS domain S-box-containing protein
MPLPVFYKDSNCRYIGFNKAYEEFIGKTRDQLLGKSVFDIAPRELADIYHAKDLELLRDQVTQVYESQVKDMHGAKHDVVFHKATFMDSNGCILGLIGTISDITERKQVEVEREEALIRLQKIASRLPGVVYQYSLRLDGSSCFPYASEAIHEIFRVSPEEVREDASKIFANIHPDDYDGVRTSLQKSARDMTPWFLEFRVKFDDGTERWLFANALPQREFDGSILWYGFITDISERKRTGKDLQKKNAEIEQFIYTVSHDLRSPLVTIKTFLGYLEQDISASDSNRIAKDLGFVHSAADRMEALLNELLDMTRVGRSTNPHETVTFQELAAEALDAVAGQITTGKVDIRVSAANPTLYGDRRRLLQIWQNLLDNALKYMGDQAEPHIEIGVEQQDGDLVFFICDNGIGIAPEYREKVFGIFEQLDRHSGGVGRGLTMIRHIVELYGGRVWVESGGQGQGCCFRFTLPGAVVNSER